jgi:GH15 family glucan-1,4-alpha-glucosidase
LLERTENYWRAWVNKNETNFDNLSPQIVGLFKRSLLIARTQIDNGGAIIAANDSDVTLRATDHYSYLWPRDGALVAHALDLAGYSYLSRSFFDLCGCIIGAEGYFCRSTTRTALLLPVGTLLDARTKTRRVPIQEDETALVLWALWNHYDKFRDIEFAKKLYRPLITRAADFIASFRDEETRLPLPSWNLWEDRRGIHTFTCATVVGGLRAAARFATLFGETERASVYAEAADEVRDAMRTYLYRTELHRFARALMPQADGNYEVDVTIDASLFGIFYFRAFAPDDSIGRNDARD